MCNGEMEKETAGSSDLTRTVSDWTKKALLLCGYYEKDFQSESLDGVNMTVFEWHCDETMKTNYISGAVPVLFEYNLYIRQYNYNRE